MPAGTAPCPTKIEAQLKAEVAELLARAEAADQAELGVDGMSIPEELALREARLAKLGEAWGKIEVRAKERFAQEDSRTSRQASGTGGEGRGNRQEAWRQAARPSVEGPQPKDQFNLTDEDSRIMPVAGGGFEQCYNAQAVVAAESLLVIAPSPWRRPPGALDDHVGAYQSDHHRRLGTRAARRRATARSPRNRR
jgi:hypothetical protein